MRGERGSKKKEIKWMTESVDNSHVSAQGAGAYIAPREGGAARAESAHISV